MIWCLKRDTFEERQERRVKREEAASEEAEWRNVSIFKKLFNKKKLPYDVARFIRCTFWFWRSGCETDDAAPLRTRLFPFYPPFLSSSKVSRFRHHIINLQTYLSSFLFNPVASLSTLALCFPSGCFFLFCTPWNLAKFFSFSAFSVSPLPVLPHCSEEAEWRNVSIFKNFLTKKKSSICKKLFNKKKLCLCIDKDNKNTVTNLE